VVEEMTNEGELEIAYSLVLALRGLGRREGNHAAHCAFGLPRGLPRGLRRWGGRGGQVDAARCVRDGPESERLLPLSARGCRPADVRLPERSTVPPVRSRARSRRAVSLRDRERVRRNERQRPRHPRPIRLRRRPGRGVPRRSRSARGTRGASVTGSSKRSPGRSRLGVGTGR